MRAGCMCRPGAGSTRHVRITQATSRVVLVCFVVCPRAIARPSCSYTLALSLPLGAQSRGRSRSKTSPWTRSSSVLMWPMHMPRGLSGRRVPQPEPPRSRVSGGCHVSSMHVTCFEHLGCHVSAVEATCLKRVAPAWTSAFSPSPSARP